MREAERVNCLKCGVENPQRARYCIKCSALLPKILAVDVEPRTLGVDDKVEYIHPTVHYETEALKELNALAMLALEGEEVFEELDEHVQALAESYATFEEDHVRPFLDALRADAVDNPDDPLPHQLSYALETGSTLFDQGCRALYKFIDSGSESPEELAEAVYKIGEGHNYLYLGIELAKQRIAEMETP